MRCLGEAGLTKSSLLIHRTQTWAEGATPHDPACLFIHPDLTQLLPQISSWTSARYNLHSPLLFNSLFVHFKISEVSALIYSRCSFFIKSTNVPVNVPDYNLKCHKGWHLKVFPLHLSSTLCRWAFYHLKSKMNSYYLHLFRVFWL